MPAFDLRYLQVAEYKKKDGGTEYGTATSMGDAMTVVLDLRFAEGRLFAESTLAEYMKKATGGTATAGVKYIPTAAQPATNFQTLGDNITFQTPTTSGEFLIDDLEDLLEVATLDSEADAKAWCDEVFKTAATDVAGG